MDHVNFALDCRLLKATHYNGSMFVHKVRKAVLYQGSLNTTFHKGCDHRRGKHPPSNQQTMSMPVVTVQSLRCQLMEKLHNVPCVQFSFSNDNTILSKSVE